MQTILALKTNYDIIIFKIIVFGALSIGSLELRVHSILPMNKILLSANICTQ